MQAQRLVVVDDEPGIGLLCGRLLRREGHTVETFTDPRAAVAALAEHPIDLLLIDIRMPEVDGFEVIAHAQRLQPECAILIMTGHGTIETAIRALRQGVDGLILKPFDRGRELLDAVEQALADSRRKRDAARTQAIRELFDVSETLLAEVDAQRLPALVLEAVCTHLGAPNAGCYFLGGEGRKRELLASRGVQLVETADDPVLSALADDAQHTGGMVVEADARSTSPFADILRRLGLWSLVVSRVDRPASSYLLYASRPMDAPPFRPMDVELLGILGRQAVIAIENAQLYALQVEHLRQVQQSQRALIQAEKMATAGRLTASIAHEVNNPLQAVENCLHLAGREDVPPEKRREYFVLAQSELQRLQLTVQRMLDFYRPSAGAQDGHELGEVVRNVLALLERQLADRKIDVRLELPAELPPVSVQSNQMQQVFMNLLLNSADAMPAGGRISIKAASEARGVEVLISDTGPGIPPEAQPSIFEPFFTTREGGTGLGLTVSYSIVSAHGGTLEYVPRQGPGACFRLFLPRAAEPVEEP